MKVTLNWLKQYVDFDWPPEELAERLTMLGIEVEGVQKIGGEFGGIVVAQVVTRDKHPNADKLSLCRVNDGKGERQIVCGANNFKPGDKVPLILPGHSLPAKPGAAAIQSAIASSAAAWLRNEAVAAPAPRLGVGGNACWLLRT